MRVAQIGVGGWGRNHTRILHRMGALAGVCDADPERAKLSAAGYGVDSYGSVAELLDGCRFDAAVVATPTITHAEVARELISAKKHVLLEKPFTYDPREGLELRWMAEKAGVVLTCGYIERFNPAVEAVRGMVDEGRCGQLMQLEFHRENRIPVHIKDVGIIYDTAVHDIDTANWLFAEMPRVVFARCGKASHDHEDFASIMLGYGGDRTAIISCNWLSPSRVRMFRAAFTGATITGDFVTQEVRIDGDAQKRDWREPLARELESFLAAAESGGPPLVTSHQAVCVTKIAEAALLSGRQGVPIYLDLR